MCELFPSLHLLAIYGMDHGHVGVNVRNLTSIDHNLPGLHVHHQNEGFRTIVISS